MCGVSDLIGRCKLVSRKCECECEWDKMALKALYGNGALLKMRRKWKMRITWGLKISKSSVPLSDTQTHEGHVPPHPPPARLTFLGVTVLVQQSEQQFSQVALLLWFFINQRQVFSSQLVNSCWCERLSSLIVCHWLPQPVLCILATSHSSGATDTNRPPGCLCGAEASLPEPSLSGFLMVLTIYFLLRRFGGNRRFCFVCAYSSVCASFRRLNGEHCAPRLWMWGHDTKPVLTRCNDALS